jgi:hypothetical protein
MSSANETVAANTAATESADGTAIAPAMASQSSSSSLLVPKVSVVTPQRKEELLLQARAERRHWIEKVPLPYDPECFQPPGSAVAVLSGNHNNSTGTPGNDLWTLPTTASNGKNQNSLVKIQSSVVCQKYLPSAMATISELYGLPTKSQSVSVISEDPPSKPLNLTQVAKRVESLVSV